MKCLLDTQAIIKIINDSGDIDNTIKDDVEYFQHHFLVSIVTLQEFVILKSLGKIDTQYSLDEFVEELHNKQIELLSVTQKHLSQLEKLLYLDIVDIKTNKNITHTDPFDRLLIAQAKSENLTIATTDAKFKYYSGLKIIDVSK